MMIYVAQKCNKCFFTRLLRSRYTLLIKTYENAKSSKFGTRG